MELSDPKHRQGKPWRRLGPAAVLVALLCFLTAGPKEPSEGLALAGTSAAPVNDAFAMASELGGDRGVVVGTTLGAGKEEGEPDHASDPGGASVWFKWTAPSEGEATFTTSLSALDSVLAVYRGETLATLTPIALSRGDPAAPEWGTVTFHATAATTYSIAVDGAGGATASFRLAWGPSAASEEFGGAGGLDPAAADAFAAEAPASFLSGLSIGNGGRPYAGDWRLLTTVTPNGDGLRDAAIISFRLARGATVSVQVFKPKFGLGGPVWRTRDVFGAGVHRITWRPRAATEPRTYLLRLVATDRFGNRVVYGKTRPHQAWPPRGPVVRIRGVDAGFTQRRYFPGSAAKLVVATDARRFSLQFFRFGPFPGPEFAGEKFTGSPVTNPVEVDWTGRRSGPVALWRRIGLWPSGLYFVRLEASDGRVGFAPFVVRPRSRRYRVAVVLPTNTWQAYNFQDANGDGWGDTWYASGATNTIDLRRPYISGGVPGGFQYDKNVVRWLERTGKKADYYTDDDLQGFRSGDRLGGYNLIIFSGHHEYVTGHEYTVVERYRNLGGNLVFLSANNFFRSVVRERQRLTLIGLWRTFGRPEAALVGVEFIGFRFVFLPYIVAGAGTTPWFFAGTGLGNGTRFGRGGIEFDQRGASSPAGTRRLAWIPNVLGSGRHAEMTFYRRSGAKVFAAGTISFGAGALAPKTMRLCENLWDRLSAP